MHDSPWTPQPRIQVDDRNHALVIMVWDVRKCSRFYGNAKQSGAEDVGDYDLNHDIGTNWWKDTVE